MFRKTALALAAASMVGPLAVQAAGPTVYGKLFVGLDKVDNGTSAPTDNQWDVHGFTSRVGVKGDHDLGAGMSAFYTYEFAVQTDTANFPGNDRLSYAGIKGGFGSVAIGKQWSTYFNMVGTHADPTQWVGTATLSPYRTPNAVKYSNDFGPVHLEADGIFNSGGGTDEQKGLDRYAVGASAVFGPVTLAAAVDTASKKSMGATDDKKLVGVAGVYDLKVVAIHAGYEQQDDGSTNKTKALTVNAVGSVDKLGYVVGIGTQKDDDLANKETKTVSFSASYSLSKNTKGLVEYRTNKVDVGNNSSDTLLALMVDF